MWNQNKMFEKAYLRPKSDMQECVCETKHPKARNECEVSSIQSGDEILLSLLIALKGNHLSCRHTVFLSSDLTHSCIWLSQYEIAVGLEVKDEHNRCRYVRNAFYDSHSIFSLCCMISATVTCYIVVFMRDCSSQSKPRTRPVAFSKWQTVVIFCYFETPLTTGISRRLIFVALAQDIGVYSEWVSRIDPFWSCVNDIYVVFYCARILQIDFFWRCNHGHLLSMCVLFNDTRVCEQYHLVMTGASTCTHYIKSYKKSLFLKAADWLGTWARVGSSTDICHSPTTRLEPLSQNQE